MSATVTSKEYNVSVEYAKDFFTIIENETVNISLSPNTMIAIALSTQRDAEINVDNINYMVADDATNFYTIAGNQILTPPKIKDDCLIIFNDTKNYVDLVINIEMLEEGNSPVEVNVYMFGALCFRTNQEKSLTYEEMDLNMLYLYALNMFNAFNNPSQEENIGEDEDYGSGSGSGESEED